MIKVIDKITYLPKAPSKSIFDENEVRNMAVKHLVGAVTQRVKKAYRGPLQVTITVTGRVSKTASKPTYDFKATCEDPHVLEIINKAIRSQ